MRHNRLIIIVAAAALLFLSCNGSFGVIVPDYEIYDDVFPRDISLTAVHNLNSGSLRAFELLSAEFNKDNKYGILINLEQSDDTAQGKADLAIVNPSEAALLLREGHSIELSPLVSHPLWGLEDGRSRFYRAARNQTDYWDFARKITSVPLSIDTEILIVNIDILQSLGYQRFPESWFKTSMLLKKAGKNGKPFGIEYNADTLVSFINARGGSILQPAEFAYSFSNPVVNRTLRYLRNYEEDGLLSVNRSKYQNQTAFAFGELLAVYTGIEGVKPYSDLIQTVNPEMNWDTALLPTRKPGDGITISCSRTAAITADSREKQLASWVFIKWLSDAEQQKKLALYANTIPAVEGVISGISFSSQEGHIPQWLSAAELVDEAHMEVVPSLYDYNSVAEQFERGFARMIAGEWVWLESLKLDIAVKRQRKEELSRRGGKR